MLFLGDNMKLHHIGIIVKDLEKNIRIYLQLGYDQFEETVIDHVQYNRIAFMKKEGEPLLELIEPLDNRSSVCNFKEGYHHLCYEADCRENVVNVFKDYKIGKIFTKPIVAPALHGSEVVFACLQNGLFIELKFERKQP